MKTLEQAYEIVERINEEAHQEAWDDWIAADQEQDDDLAEQLRDEASEEQSSWFRHFFWSLTDEDRTAIKYWLVQDEDFADQFMDWYDRDAFEEEIDLHDSN